MHIQYIIKRVLQMIPIMIIITIIVFFVIQLPPGDFLATYMAERELQGGYVMEASEVEALRERFGLDRPIHEQYIMWMSNIILRGDLGRSFFWNMPVNDIVSLRLAGTIAISLGTLIFIWAVSIPIGIYSATHQYSKGDYIFTFIGFIGQAIPAFLIALVAIYLVFITTGVAVSGLFSSEFTTEPWSFAKILDMMPRLFLVIFIIGLSGTAGMIRTTRAMMLDELGKQYVVTARAKGVEEHKLIYKYPVRMAINPLISTIGASLGGLISGETVVSIVFNLPTTGPILFRSLLIQDMYLAGGFLLIMSIFVVIGTFISDIMLSVLDPRIRYGGVIE